ncbi:hypothetical protein ACFL58_02790 [Elusimicrobiota bacterium]
MEKEGDFLEVFSVAVVGLEVVWVKGRETSLARVLEEIVYVRIAKTSFLMEEVYLVLQ